MRLTQRLMLGNMLLLAMLLAACSPTQTSPTLTTPPSDGGTSSSPTADTLAGVDQSPMPRVGGADTPYDAVFLNAMIRHHAGSFVMARQALERAERQEIKIFANTILTVQRNENAQIREWGMTWYQDLAEVPETLMDMRPMEVPAGPSSFDQRFLEVMIAHHQQAITMAQDALQNAEHQELKDFAREIIAARQTEIIQMRQWLQE